MWHQLRFWLGLVITGFVSVKIWNNLIIAAVKTTYKSRIQLYKTV